MPDRAIVDPGNYTVTSGSTIITFKESYLKALSAGTHTFRVEFTDGYADLMLTVQTLTVPDNTVVNPPKTGDYARAGVLGVWMVGFAIVASAVAWHQRRHGD